MIDKRFFLRLLAVLPLSGLAASRPARAAASEVVDYPGRIELTARMVQIHALRKLIDAGARELDAVYAKYEAQGDPTFGKKWFAEADPLYRWIMALQEQLTELERESLDCLIGDPAAIPGGALACAASFATSNEQTP